jgi:hypothetical protein
MVDLVDWAANCFKNYSTQYVSILEIEISNRFNDIIQILLGKTEWNIYPLLNYEVVSSIKMSRLLGCILVSLQFILLVHTSPSFFKIKNRKSWEDGQKFARILVELDWLNFQKKRKDCKASSLQIFCDQIVVAKVSDGPFMKSFYKCRKAQRLAEMFHLIVFEAFICVSSQSYVGGISTCFVFLGSI